MRLSELLTLQVQGEVGRQKRKQNGSNNQREIDSHALLSYPTAQSPCQLNVIFYKLMH